MVTVYKETRVVKEPTCRWGILGAGAISEKFVRDLLIDPNTRGVSDVTHKVAAIGSRSVEKARKFISRIGNLEGHSAKAYGTYEELVSDPNIDVIYIGTPHPFHFPNVMLCLEHNKHVLCEKPLTVNAGQARELCKVAKEKKCFLMEALWTRFFPLTYSLQKILASGKIGEIQRVDSDFSINFSPDSLPLNHRLVDPKLAGGGLLDLGPYSWTMLALTLLHQNIKPAGSAFGEDGANTSDSAITNLPIPEVKASGVLYKHPQAETSSNPVDGSVMAVLEFSSAGRKTQGLLISTMFQTTNEDRAVTIYGSKGRIRIPSPSCCPMQFSVQTSQSENGEVLKSAKGRPELGPEEVHSFEIPGNAKGYMWEADEVARCIASGQLESKRMPHSESILMLEIFDEIRKQIGVEYPKPLESIS